MSQTPNTTSPPVNPYYKPPASVERFTLDEGPVVLQWPCELSQVSVEFIECWFDLLMRRARRRAEERKLPLASDLINVDQAGHEVVLGRPKKPTKAD